MYGERRGGQKGGERWKMGMILRVEGKAEGCVQWMGRLDSLWKVVNGGEGKGRVVDEDVEGKENVIGMEMEVEKE